MGGLGDWIRCIKTLGTRHKLYKNKQCQIDGRSLVNFLNCEFEGNNQVGKFTILNHCYLGYASYISESSCLLNTRVGKYCAIGPNVHVVNGQHPTKRYVSIHPAFYSNDATHSIAYVDENRFEEFRYVDKKNGYWVYIGNDVWIGDSALIMEGVTIADGTIVAAGAIVVKDTEPYTIVGGNPAKIIRYRFNKQQIDYLLHLKWWNKDENWIKQHAIYFDDVDRLRDRLEENTNEHYDNRTICSVND